jgi:hypothetical protein
MGAKSRQQSFIPSAFRFTALSTETTMGFAKVVKLQVGLGKTLSLQYAYRDCYLSGGSITIY